MVSMRPPHHSLKRLKPLLASRVSSRVPPAVVTPAALTGPESPIGFPVVRGTASE